MYAIHEKLIICYLDPGKSSICNAVKISYFLIGDAFMKNMLFSVGILAAAFTTSTHANAAAFIVFDESTGMFGNTGIGSGPFSDPLNFEVPELEIGRAHV